jgi:hypothetical protein
MTAVRSPNLAEVPADGSWERQILPVICRLLDLPDNWDSYGGRPLKLETGMFALKILNEIMDAGTPIPQVVPIAAGGIQLEWHENDLDLELMISAPDDGELWFEDHRTGASDSIALSSDLSPLRAQMARLVQSEHVAGDTSKLNV